MLNPEKKRKFINSQLYKIKNSCIKKQNQIRPQSQSYSVRLTPKKHQNTFSLFTPSTTRQCRYSTRGGEDLSNQNYFKDQISDFSNLAVLMDLSKKQKVDLILKRGRTLLNQENDANKKIYFWKNEVKAKKKIDKMVNKTQMNWKVRTGSQVKRRKNVDSEHCSVFIEGSKIKF